MIVAMSDWLAMRERLESLFLASFGSPIKPGYLDWRYFDNDQPHLLFSLDMKDDRPMSSYSAFPVELICSEKKYQTAISMTTMTHPMEQGKGRIVRVAKELYEYAENLGIAGVWGFPNAKIHLLRKAVLGWSDIYEIPTMTFDLAKADTGKLSLSVEVQRDDEFSQDYPDLPNDGLIRVHRSKSYLSWRYARNPINTYHNFVICRKGKVSSYVVTKSYGDGIDLVDIQPGNPQEARILLEHIAKLSLDKGVKHICCWAPTHHSVHGVLERLGFLNSSPITYFGGRELIPSATPPGWSNYKNWYIQMGDSDVY
jgi:hypothetical protein